MAQAYDSLRHWPDRPDYLDHELEHGRLVVAQEDDGLISGFGAALERDGVTYLADLFILPDHVGGGRGRAIMGELFPARGARFTFASSDPRARPLYESCGMRGGSPLLYLGAAARVARAAPDPGISLREVEAGDVVELDAAATGRRRPQDLAFLGSLGSFFVTDGAYAYLRIIGDEALLNPSGARDPEALAGITLAVVRRAAERAAVIRVAAMEPHPALPHLLAAGFRPDGFDTYMSTAPGLVDGAAYGPSPLIG